MKLSIAVISADKTVRKTMKKLWTKIVIMALGCLLLGTSSGLVTVSEIGSWYAGINKPTWNPPSWLFGPVWTLLYILMGVAAALVWHAKDTLTPKALQTFVIQFILNLAWSPLFFYFHLIGLALAEMLVMWVLIIITIKQFYAIHKGSAYLLIPYLAWVSFATFLTATIYYLN
jgi:benzodiazapine receptor